MKINGYAKNETDILAKKCYEMMRQMYNSFSMAFWFLGKKDSHSDSVNTNP